MTGIRGGEPSDLPEIAAIRNASPEAADWCVSADSQYQLRVAVREHRVVGFLVWRRVADDEAELLNLAVAPEFRRQGIARKLLADLLSQSPGTVFLEVRESNHAARYTYKSMGFTVVGRRSQYYQNPPETAIVMKFHSC